MIANGTESNELDPFSQIRGIVEQGLGHFFITSSRSHFLNETDFEQYLLKEKKSS